MVGIVTVCQPTIIPKPVSALVKWYEEKYIQSYGGH